MTILNINKGDEKMSYQSKYTGEEIDNLLDVVKGLNIEETILWEGEVTTEGVVVNLNDSIENYDYIVVYNGYYNKSGYKRISPHSTFSVEYILKEGYNEKTLYLNDNGSVNVRNEWTAHSNFWVIAPTQIKLAVTSISNGEIGLAYIDRIVGIKLNPIASENDYSTEEQRIGTWIDGKPLYRKVYKLDITATSTRQTTIIEEGFGTSKKVKNIYGNAYCNNGSHQYTIGFIDANIEAEQYFTFSTGVGENNLLIHSQWPVAIDFEIEVVVEYIKTID